MQCARRPQLADFLLRDECAPFHCSHTLRAPPAVPYKLLLDERRILHPVRNRHVLCAGVICVRHMYHPLCRGHVRVLLRGRLRGLPLKHLQRRGCDGLLQLPRWIRHML